VFSIKSLPKNAKSLAVLALFALSALFSFLAWQHFYPAQVGAGWSFDIYREGIPQVSALVIDQKDNLYVSQEFNNGKGVIFRLKPDGTKQDILNNLAKPDGLVLYRDGIVASQEGGKNALLWWKESGTEPMFVGDSVEGLASDGHHLFAVEDLRQGGRLLKYDPQNGEVKVLRDDLEEPEGVAVCADGSLFYTEKKKGWIKRFQPGNTDEIIVRGLHAPSFLMCNHEGLWITEDLTHGARLMLLGASGNLETILTHLRSPQTIIQVTPTRFLVAEQGRGRILVLNRLANAKQ
jgi:hypothetical protein